MKKRKWKFYDYEIYLIINALVEWRNRIKAEGKYSDAIDELLLKILK